jgi:hypothetical protein
MIYTLKCAEKNEFSLTILISNTEITTDGGIVYKQILKSVKFTTGKKGKKTELTGRGPLRRRRSALDCSATEEEEEYRN